MKASWVAVGLAGLTGLFPGIAMARYSSPPPPPPTPGVCVPCSPPPPPSLVPTAPPNTLPRVTAVVSVSVRLAPSRVRRGSRVKLLVVSAAKEPVSILVRYRFRKPWYMRSRTNDIGRLQRSWKVGGNAPLGRATVIVVVKHTPKPYVAAVSFTIIK